MALPKLFDLITWHNNTTPALNEDNLNAMSQAIDDIDDRVIDLAGTIMEDVPQIQEDMEILGPAVENIDENVARAEAAADSAEQYAEEIAPPIEVVKDYADIITIEDAINKAAKDLKVKVDAVQDLHGYTKPWVGGAGKNKLTFTLAGLKTLNTEGTWSGNVYSYKNITVTVQTDSADNVLSIKINGTSSGSFWFTLCTLSLGVSSWKLNGTPTGGTSSISYIRVGKGADNSFFASCLDGEDKSIAISEADNYTFVIAVQNAAAHNNLVYTPMLRDPSASATYESPTNICPITGHSEANLTGAGKNVCPRFPNTGSVSGVDYTTNADGSVTGVGTSTGQVAFYAVQQVPHLLPAGNYILSAGNEASVNLRIVVSIKRQSGIVYYYEATSNADVPFTILDTDQFQNVYIRTNGGNTAINGTLYPMIRRAEFTDNSYEPYMGEVYTIDLNGTRYRGTLDVTSGVLTVKGGEGTINGTEPVYDMVTTDTYKYFTINKAFNDGIAWDENVISNMIANNTQQPLPLTGPRFQLDGNKKVRIYLPLSDSSTTEDYKTLFQATNFKFIYNLATPQTIQLTAEEVTLLWAYNTLFADTGDISLRYDASGVLRIAFEKLDIDTFKAVVAASSDFADFKSRVAAL